MAEESIAVGVIVEKRKAASPWIDHIWSPVAVLPGLPEAASMTLIETSISINVTARPPSDRS